MEKPEKITNKPFSIIACRELEKPQKVVMAFSVKYLEYFIHPLL
jgi:hypothetical protein